jgi:hypothetical protein
VEKHYVLGDYKAIDPTKEAAVADPAGKDALKKAKTAGQFSALGKMALFPAFMLASYICLILYFKARGGYKPVALAEASPAGTS